MGAEGNVNDGMQPQWARGRDIWVMVGFLTANCVVISVSCYALMIAAMLPVTNQWGSAAILGTAIWIPPLTTAWAVQRLRWAERRAFASVIVMTLVSSHVFAGMWLSFNFVMFATPPDLLAGRRMLAGMCERFCPEELLASYREDVERGQRRLFEQLDDLAEARRPFI